MSVRLKGIATTRADIGLCQPSIHFNLGEETGPALIAAKFIGQLVAGSE
jgi:hypothetical protein